VSQRKLKYGVKVWNVSLPTHWQRNVHSNFRAILSDDVHAFRLSSSLFVYFWLINVGILSKDRMLIGLNASLLQWEKQSTTTGPKIG
jgi:hypothetical protein